MASRIVPALVALLALAALADRALACDCSGVSLGDAYRTCDAVFAGRVAEITEETLKPERLGDREFRRTRLWAKFEVDEAFKGVDGAAAVVSPGEKGSTCSANLTVGERYIVFAHRSKEDLRLYTSLCDPTGTAEGQTAALVYCRRVARDGKEPRVIGTLFEASPSTADDVRADARTLAGIPVSLEAGGKTYDAVTDRDGVFVLDDVPDGTYVVRFVLPKEYRMLYFWAFGGDDPSERAKTVRVGGPVWAVRALVTTSGVITGRFLDASGKPFVGLPLCLVLRDRLESEGPGAIVAHATTESDGGFRIEPLAPGEYVLAVNWPPIPKIDRPPLPGFLCADKADASKPAVHTISPGRHIALGDLKTPPPPPHVTIDVAVVDEKDKPVRTMLTCQIDGGRPVGFVWTDEETGRARIYLPTGKRYSLDAKAFVGGGRLESETVSIDPATAPPNMTVVVRPVSAP